MDAVIPPVTGSTNKREAIDFVLLEPNEKDICFVTKAAELFGRCLDRINLLILNGVNEKLSGLWFAW